MNQTTNFVRTSRVTAVGDDETAAFADLPCTYVTFQAHPDNTGVVEIVGVNGAGTVDTAGIVLAAGEFSPLMPGPNLNRYGYIIAATDDAINIVRHN